MRDKNSFVLFYDIYDVVTALKAEQKGLLFQAILDYQITGKHEPTGDLVVDVAFIPIKQSLDRNNEKWEREKLARSEAGKKGMESRYNKAQQKVTKPNKNNQSVTKAKPKDNQEETKEKPTVTKDKYGLAGNVKLTKEEFDKLVSEYGMKETQKAIQYLDDYIADKGYKSKSNYSAMRRWVFDAVRERDQKAAKSEGKRPVDTFFADVEGGFYDERGNQENTFCG